MEATPERTVLGAEAERIAAFESMAPKSDGQASEGGRTAAMVMADAAASLLAQANYSRQNVSELLTFMPTDQASETA